MKNFFEKIKRHLEQNSSDYKLLFIIIVFMTLVGYIVYPVHNIRHGYHKYTTYEIYNETNKLVHDSIKLALLNEVDGYIKKVAPSSSLSGLAIINTCIKNDIDICFVLSQAEQESHFGTAGLARKTNSVFNVFAFDGHDYNAINSNGKYAHPNDCVEPYIQLLKKDYLVDGKTEYDMLNKYVNKHGKRYASSETYESALQNNFLRIKTTTKIDSLSQELHKYRLILGIN